MTARPATQADPLAVDLVEPTRRWSRSDVASAVAVLAAELAARGVGHGDVVAVVGGRRVGTVVGALAAWQVGGAFLVIDPQLPAARVAAMLADSSPAAVLAESAHAGMVPNEAQVITLPGEPPASGSPAAAAAAVPADDDPAYLIFTSGTTGTPKAVVASHGGVRHIIAAQRAILGLGPDTVVYQAAPVSFDAFVFEILMAVGSGGALVLPDPLSELPGRGMLERLRAERVTHLVTTPTALSVMAPDALPHLRVVCSVGEACTPGVRDAWARDRRLLNLYGPAEATIWATYAELPADGDPRSIGRPIAGVTAFALDDDGRPVGPGTPGQLHLAGPTVALGYLGHPELTAARFAAGPDGERRYATGDIVVAGPDGDLRFCGRADRQVKVRGVRIEPDEIERVMTSFPGVDGAVVTVVSTAAAEPDTIAAVYAPTSADPVDVARYLRERLPRWMVPQRVAAVGALPVTTTGKVDEEAVKAFLLAAASDDGEAEAFSAGSPLADFLLDGVRELLTSPAVTLEDNFFDVGGDSLTALDVIVRAGDALGRDLDLEALFGASTLRAWAAAVEEQIAQPGGARRPTLAEAPPADGQVSAGQAEILAAEQLLAGSAAYVSSWCELVRGAFDLDAFAAALQDTVQAHEILRTRYEPTAGAVTSVVDDAAAVRCVVHPATTEQAAIELVERACAEPIRVDVEQPVRLHVVQIDAEAHVVAVLVHHAACDESSIGLLLDEVWTRYGDPSATTTEPVAYRRFVDWQRALLAGDAAEEMRGWWREQLDGLRPVALERVDAGGPQSATRGARVGRRLGFTVDQELATTAETVRRELGLSPFALLSAAFALALEPYVTDDECVVGTPCAARGLSEFERGIGFFVNTLPLPLRVPARGSVREWLRTWQHVCVGYFARRDLPLTDIGAQWRKGGGGGPLSVLFSHGYARPAARASAVTRESVRLDPGPVKFPLVFTLTRDARTWTGEVVHDTAVLSAAEAAELLDNFTDALTALCADPDRDLADLRRRHLVGAFDFGPELGPSGR